MDWLFKKITDLSGLEYNVIYNNLSESRKAHIDKMRFKDDKLRSLLATHIIDELLAKQGITNAKLQVAPNGKPVLSESEFFISISHSHNGVVCAVSKECVGIDIEIIKPVKSALIKRVCTKSELEYVLKEKNLEQEQISDYNTLVRFFEVWTSKEAYFKKHGTKSMLKTDTLLLPKEHVIIDEYLITVM